MINRVHGGNVWPHFSAVGGSAAGASNYKITDFSASINPLSAPQEVKEIIAKNIDKLRHYPDPDSKRLKKALASSCGVSSSNLLAGNGSIELIYLILQALRPKNVLIPSPTFSEYEFASRINRAQPVFIGAKENEGFRLDLSLFKKLIPQAEAVFLCNPNNPTGTLLLRKEILTLLDICRKNKVMLIIDEVFMDFLPQRGEFTLTLEAVRNKNLLILRSLTKIFAIAGLRLGYLIGHTKVINRIARFQHPWNVNSLAQLVGQEIVKDKKYMRQSQDLICKEKEYLFDNLSRIKGIKVYPSAANFFLCKLGGSRIKDAHSLSKKLIGRGILIRNCQNFRGLNNKFFRIAVRIREENMRLIAALKDVI